MIQLCDWNQLCDSSMTSLWYVYASIYIYCDKDKIQCIDISDLLHNITFKFWQDASKNEIK